MDITKRIEKLYEILKIAQSLSSEKNLDRLLNMIADSACRVVNADRVTIFLFDHLKNELWSKIAQGMGVSEIRFPIDDGIAGYVARTSQPLSIVNAYEDPRFNRNIDVLTGYQTQTILCIPMYDYDGETVGVIQALNKKNGLFNEEDRELLMAFGGQAAVAIKNSVLHQEISNILEGFIKASGIAVESRDPATRGHSKRVARLSVKLAQALCESGSKYQEVIFTKEQLIELEYAALLHDFGKLAVRAEVLVKANKLFPYQLTEIALRFEAIQSLFESELLQKALAQLQSCAEKEKAALLDSLQTGCAEKKAQIEQMFDYIQYCNYSRMLTAAEKNRLFAIAEITYTNGKGVKHPYLTAEEISNLTIDRGTLNQQERKEIESHVENSFRFLSQIPWTRSLRSIPEIVYAHHEKLNGSGYPRNLNNTEIPIQSKIMTIVDVYDALTSSDRPYRKALSSEKAFEILNEMAQNNEVDPDLLAIFITQQVYLD